MGNKRPMGALEDEVMTYLWATAGPATAADVHEAVAPDLAYTTVMTVLSRLFAKGHLSREPKGRGFAYLPVATEAEHRAKLMQDTLNHSKDRDGVLSSFVGSLTARDLDELKRLLTDENR